MIKKIFAVLCCVTLCFVVNILCPSLGRSTLEVDDSLCMECHTASDLHGVETHNNCTSQCHEDIPHGGVITFPVKTSKCIECHPFDDPAECTLIVFHQGMTDCLSCHAADCEGVETTATTTAPSSPSHINTCLPCHDAGDPGVEGETIHGDHTDASCSDCHNGAPLTGNVELDNCIACHPLDNPGDCNLVDFHDPDIGGDCHKCHIDCDENTNSHIEECLLCHVVDNLHDRSGHSGDCAQCHDGTPLTGNVQTDKCIVCHPLGNIGKCNLENYHDPVKGTSCHECHINCTGGESTTTTASTGTHEESGIVDDSLCLACHDIGSFGAQDGTLHGEHGDCDQCHEEGVGREGNVQADKCMVCHSLGNPGECNVVNDHGGACLKCHNECTGEGVTTTVPPTTTTISFMHIYTCLSCHELIDLHADQGHKICVTCHEGGNVVVGKCVVCHPTDGPGKCNLTHDHHQSACLKCHDECIGGATTTTTKASSFEQHIDTCLECHVKDDLHAEQEHSDCTQCHEGDKIVVYKCAVCHPTGDPGKCNLANDHHASACLTCHSDCSEETTTTTADITSTTTTIEDFPNPVTVDIKFKLDSVFRSHLVPFPLIMFIEGTDSHFNRTTTVSFEGSVIWPPIRLVLSPTNLLVCSLINPAGFQPIGSIDVTVNVSSTVDSGEEEPYEEIGSCTLNLIMLPFILDEEEEKLAGET